MRCGICAGARCCCPRSFPQLADVTASKVKSKTLRVSSFVEAIRTMTTTLFAAVTTTQEIFSGEDHQPIFEVVVLAFFKRLWLITLFNTRSHLCVMCFVWLKTRSSRPLCRSGPAYESHSRNIPVQRDCRRSRRSAVAFVHHRAATNSSHPDQLWPAL